MPDLIVHRPKLALDFVEREYNNRALVPQYPQHLQRWTTASENAREGHRFTTHRFGAQPNATLDLFDIPSPSALFIFIHGGYWRALTKDDFSFIAPSFCAAGIAPAILNYDLCPNATIGSIIDQVVAGLHYLDRIPRIPQRWIIAGHSAGGHLTAAMWSPLAKIAPQVRSKIVGGMTISGVHDLDPMVDYSINADLRLDREEAHRLSPLAYTPRLQAPLIVAAGGAESSEFKRQAQSLHDAWPQVCQHQKAGIVFPPNLNHFTILDALSDPHHGLFKRISALL